MTKDPYFYWYRQTTGGQPGEWYLCGPFVDDAKAKADRQRDKIDGDVGIVFSAASKAEAQKQTHWQ